jgi:hypothetical protein
MTRPQDRRFGLPSPTVAHRDRRWGRPWRTLGQCSGATGTCDLNGPMRDGRTAALGTGLCSGWIPVTPGEAGNPAREG